MLATLFKFLSSMFKLENNCDWFRIVSFTWPVLGIETRSVSYIAKFYKIITQQRSLQIIDILSYYWLLETSLTELRLTLNSVLEKVPLSH